MRKATVLLVTLLLAMVAIVSPGVSDARQGTPAAGTPASGSAAAPVPDENGLISIESTYGVTETMDRLEAAMEEAGLIVVARIDHAANAASVDLELRPTELIIFGNPMVGTVLMQEDQAIGIDLPQKFLAWEDADGTVWLSWNDPVWMADRHGITAADETIQMIANAQLMLARNATGNA